MLQSNNSGLYSAAENRNGHELQYQQDTKIDYL